MKNYDLLNEFSEEELYYISTIKLVYKKSPEVATSIVKEIERQRSSLKLIASENYSSISVQAAMGSLLTDKYAEGIPFHRFYAGCENVDDIETYAIEKAKELFGADHAFVQAHSGSDANLLAYSAILRTRIEVPYLESVGVKDVASLTDEQWKTLRTQLYSQRLMSLDYYSGGHLTHGYKHNISGKMFETYSYSVNKDTYLLDYDELRKEVKRIKPLILLSGYSAYPRKINFKIMKSIADECGATLMVDMAHFAGLVAGKVFTGEYDPVKWADVVTSTTHKTLRGPRGGLVLCKNEYKESVDKACPLMMGGPITPILAAKAVAFTEALSPEYKDYASQVVKNTAALATSLMKDEGLEVLTGGTENHLLLVDVSPLNLTGKQAEFALRDAGITLNRNALPYDKNGPWYTSGLRLGPTALTTLGMKEAEMKEIAHLIATVLKNTKPLKDEKGKNGLSRSKWETEKSVIDDTRLKVKNLLNRFPLYPSINTDLLIKSK